MSLYPRDDQDLYKCGHSKGDQSAEKKAHASKGGTARQARRTPRAEDRVADFGDRPLSLTRHSRASGALLASKIRGVAEG